MIEQLPRAALPACPAGDATTYRLIGDRSLMEQHITNGRLSATVVPAGGQAPLEAPRPGEDLFLYITDGAGYLCQPGAEPAQLGQYDVLLARPEQRCSGPMFLDYQLPMTNHSTWYGTSVTTIPRRKMSASRSSTAV